MARKATLGEIREFVYLDEVAVESMLAAVDGEILVQTSRTDSRTREFSVGSTQKADGSFGTPEIASGLKLGRSRGTEETRKSVAQSAFARFRNKNVQSFRLRRTISDGWRTRRRLAARDAKGLRKLGAGVRVADLRRGDLLEIEVTLSAAEIFQLRTAINAVSDVVNSFPDFLPIEQREIFRMVRPLTTLIDTLNADAIPVVAVLPNLEVATIQGDEWLILAPGQSSAALELHAVTSPEWFWGDVGRTLFQMRRYTILCRIIDPVIRRDPSGSYVGAILSAVHPQLAETIDNFGPTMMGALRDGTARGATQGRSDWASSYVQKVAELAGVDVPSTDFEGLAAVDMRRASVNEQLQYFRAIDQACGLAENSFTEELTALRAEIRDEFQLWPWSPQTATARPTERITNSPRLEVELIAAYW